MTVYANTHKNSFWHRLWKQKVLYMFLLPAVAFTLVFNYRPMYGIVMAFQKYDILKGIWGSEFTGLANFKEFLANPDFYNALRNTAALSILNLAIGFSLPIIFAILINEFSWNKYRKIVQSVTYLPHFVSWVIVAGLLYRMLDQDSGIVNIFLQAIGSESIGFFREPKYFWGIFITAGVWKELGWNSILYLSAMTSINPELYEAATTDGAGRLRRIWHITLPGILPTITMLLILTISSFFTSGGAFEPIMALRNPMVAQTSDIIDVYTYFRGIRMGDYGYATAIGLTQAVMSILLLFTANKGMKKFTGYSLF
ncbi:MAG: hypothetical protein A2Y21_00935 [Clostridiales bacterium GWC2_40_7]|nr:MAG: hypothetical protein A2Y21_00935 [Clostridiales bacterium GWC2_40_7]